MSCACIWCIDLSLIKCIKYKVVSLILQIIFLKPSWHMALRLYIRNFWKNFRNSWQLLGLYCTVYSEPPCILKSSGKFFLDWFDTRWCYENLLNFLPYCTSCTVKIQSTIQDLFNKYLAFLRGKRRENVKGNWTCQPRLKNESEVEIN